MHIRTLFFVLLCALLHSTAQAQTKPDVTIPDTGQNRCYSNTRAVTCPAPGQAYFGQDAQYLGRQPALRDNGDGTVTDLNTGLMWSQAVSPQKMGLEEAQLAASRLILGGYGDWRLPNIKELYSLIDFRGYTGSADRQQMGVKPADAVPFINTDFFDFRYGAEGERYIDAQWLSATRYVSTTMDRMETLFGVNFADGRIKGYGYRKIGERWQRKKFYVRYVRGAPYGDNRFEDNGDGTITDQASGLMWARADSGRGMNWRDALAYAQDLELAGYSDWRLPNAKELQYLVDYSRAPDTTGTAAIDPLFRSTSIVNEAGEKDYPAYWTSTTHLDGHRPGASAVYIAFGRALGQMHGRIMDVHGAGAQRSDPKSGRAELGRGPQGDAVRVDNFVRVVRGGGARLSQSEAEIDYGVYPYRVVLAADRSAVNRQGMREDKQAMPRTTAQDVPRSFVDRLDRDGDGRVSRDEFDGPAERFDYHDANADGYLSDDEAHRPPGTDRAANRDSSEPGYQADFDPQSRAAFARRFIRRLDRNADGRIAPGEFDGPQDRFSVHDTDGDGFLSLDEAQNLPAPGPWMPPRPGSR